MARAVPLLIAVLVVTVGCGSASTPPRAVPVTPADMLLRPAQLPAGFVPTQLSVGDLVAANKTQIDMARTAGITPDICRPTADADLNGQLRQDNSAVLAAANGGNGLVELVSTARRDLAADLRTLTGACARTVTTIREGNLRGTRIETTYTTLPDSDITAAMGESAATVEQMVAVASSVRTTLPDGAARTQAGYAGYALVARPGADPVTVQLTVSGADGAATANPAAPVQPMERGAFVALYGSALRAAAEP